MPLFLETIYATKDMMLTITHPNTYFISIKYSLLAINNYLKLFLEPTRLLHIPANICSPIPTLNLSLLLLTFLIIAIYNSSIKNPGPQSSENHSTTSRTLKVYYQNVQGLIPFTELNKKHPNLDQTKLLELQSYVYENCPDVIVLNETWLKDTILDEEIFSNTEYKIYRCDRTEFSHPPEPTNRLKFRRNGGGVLIAISSSLQISSNHIELKCKAEFLAIELIMDDGCKVVISTCYRVGTLGAENYHQVTSALGKLLRKKKLKKFFLIGDLNLNTISWEANSCTNSTDQLFLDEFVRLGLLQCISSPTHIKGNLLDILLTNSENHVSNINVLSTNVACKSDHFAITFEVKLKLKRKKPWKINTFNYKRANWDALNSDLHNINWLSVLDSQEPDIVWQNFKTLLNHFLELHIPKITIKSKFQPPWFDSECYVKCREKERLHKRFKSTKSIRDELKFTNCRREFKSLIRSKIRDNLHCSRDSNTITKKFWSHVKSKTKSTRIPEVVKHENSISSDTLTKANMFNKYFYEQFSTRSSYDINIDFSNDHLLDIDFSCTRIKN